MATLIFNEKCEINIDDQPFEDYIKDVLKANSFNREYQRYLEYGFALGGHVAKVYFDGKVRVSFVTADCFVPVRWSADEVQEGVFVTETTKGQDRYTLLEWHVWEGQEYIIKNELYKSKNREELGVKVPLPELYPDLEERVGITGLSGPMFAYWKPNTANNFDFQSPLGISLFANALDTLKDLDAAFDSFQREFKLGKKRIIVSEKAIRTVVDTQTGQMRRWFDSSDEVYEAMDTGDENMIQEVGTTLRVEEHIGAINAYLTILATQIGMSPGAFSFDANGLKTATEVISQNDETFRTKQSHETTVEAFVQRLIAIIADVSALYGVYRAPESYEVTVSFDDSIAEDATATANRQILLVGAGLQSKVRAIMKVQGVSKDEAEEILKAIVEEQRMAMSSQVDMMGIGLGVEMNADTGTNTAE
jgi:A118 family predicted phage portal protein